MDQSAFRALLDAPRPVNTASTSRSFGLSQRKPKQTAAATPSLPTESSTSLKPRISEKKAVAKEKSLFKGGYVDRAAARRQGVDSESAASKLLEELEAENAARLAQKEAEAEANIEDLLDETLKQETPVPVPAQTTKKRTREDILKELQASKAGKTEAYQTETAASLPASKFRKIGTAPAEPAKKVKKSKKKRKVEETPIISDTKEEIRSAAETSPIQTTSQAETRQDVTSTELAPLEPPIPAQEQQAEAPPAEDDDFDIFAGAGEYKGLAEDGDDEDDMFDTEKPPPAAPLNESGPVRKQNYFDDDSDVEQDPLPPVKPTAQPVEEEETENATKSTRLVGFGDSSTDIRALLAADKAAEKEEKRKERKEKYKAKQNGDGGEEDAGAEPKQKKKLTDADKLNRDYQEVQKRMQSK